MIRGRLRTADRLQQMGICNGQLYYLCGNAQETHKHLFFECDYARRCLKLLGNWLGIDGMMLGQWQWILRSRMLTMLQRQVIGACVCGVIHGIWMQRNKLRVEGVKMNPTSLLQLVQQEVKVRVWFVL